MFDHSSKKPQKLTSSELENEIVPKLDIIAEKYAIDDRNERAKGNNKGGKYFKGDSAYFDEIDLFMLVEKLLGDTDDDRIKEIYNGRPRDDLTNGHDLTETIFNLFYKRPKKLDKADFEEQTALKYEDHIANDSSTCVGQNMDASKTENQNSSSDYNEVGDLDPFYTKYGI